MQGKGDGELCLSNGEKITVNKRIVTVQKKIGEGGFSYIYLAKDEETYVLKITAIRYREQHNIASKEVELLQRLKHPSIVRMIDHSFRVPSVKERFIKSWGTPKPLHMILLEYCEGGNLLDVMHAMEAKNDKFSLTNLIVQFGQICNAASFLHAQKPPVVHRDMKPSNFLVVHRDVKPSNFLLKLCDFGSAVIGDVSLETSTERAEAEEVIQKTTTQMFRAPEMVDLFMKNKLTYKTDVWALGCCLYSMAFFQNCFEEGSNLAILSRNYKIPSSHSYTKGLEDLISRMLTIDSNARPDMSQVIISLSALYSGNPLPDFDQTSSKQQQRVGTYRTDGQGIHHTPQVLTPSKATKPKKLNPNSAAFKRKTKRDTHTKLDTPTKNSFETTFQEQHDFKEKILENFSCYFCTYR